MKKNKIFVACDNTNVSNIKKIIKETENSKLKVGYKFGLEFLNSKNGRNFVSQLKKKLIFADLKLHDIPNTMAKALESLSELPVGMITLHAGAGPEALARCSQFARENIPNVTLLGVTVLTSTNQQGLEAVGVKDPIEDQVLRLAQLAVDQGIGGIVCSPLELPRLRQALPSSITLVTPGIRPANADTADQKRIMTPRQAKLAGANYLVIGRPILAATDPKMALDSILEELSD